MSNLITDYLLLRQLHKVAQQLAAHAFCPGTARHHTLQAQAFIRFCDHYHLHFIDPDIFTMCLFITHLTCHFSSACSIRNYQSQDPPQGVGSHSRCPGVHSSGSRHFHVNATPVTSSNPTSTPPLPLLPHIQLGVLPSCLAGVSHLWVFAMLRQSNLAQPLLHSSTRLGTLAGGHRHSSSRPSNSGSVDQDPPGSR